MKTEHRYLAHEIRNNRLSRWFVSYLNKRLARAGSCWRLIIRYRSPTHPQLRNTFGDVQQKHAKRFAIYLVESPAYQRAKQRRMQEISLSMTKPRLVSEGN